MLAERQIRRLQAQHKEDRLKLLTGRAQKAIDDKMCDIDDFEDEDEVEVEDNKAAADRVNAINCY